MQHLCAMLSSVQKNTTGIINIHIFNDDFTEIDQEFIKDVFSTKENLIFNFYTIKDDRLHQINIVAEHLTIQTLYRLLVANILPDYIEKVIYLDSDLIVEKNIRELYELPLDQYFIGAVNELFEPILPIIKFDSIKDYFNAGVLLIDLKQWRKNNFFEECLDYAIHNPERLIFGDQDVLNGVLKGNWKRIPLEWNVTREFIENKQRYSEYYPEMNIDKILADPSIIHYTSTSKPWHYLDNHPYRDRYFHYLDQIQYKYEKFKEQHILRSKKIVLFGASQLGSELLTKLTEKNVNVEYFCDNSSQKWGAFLGDIEIIRPDQLLSMNDVIIIISSMYVKEISQQLTEMGLVENVDFCKIHTIYRLI